MVLEFSSGLRIQNHSDFGDKCLSQTNGTAALAAFPAPFQRNGNEGDKVASS